MYGRMLVPLDGSEHAETALRFAELIPSRTIRLVAVEPVKLTAARERWARGQTPPGGGSWLTTRPSVYLGIIATQFRDRGRNTELVVDSGEPGPAIVDLAAEADLIVMATRGGGATAALIGSTADYVARHAPVPTLLIREVAAATIRRIMVPLDGGARAEEAIPLAAAMRQEFGGSVLLVRVVDPSTSIATARELKEAADGYLRQQAERIGDAETVDVEVPVLRAGTVAECLMEVAEPGDIIVMASRHRTRLAQLLLGSVAAPLVRSAPVPVVLVPGIPGHMASALHAAASGIGRSDSV